MPELRDFLVKNKELIHELLNHLWRTIEQIALRFEPLLPDLALNNTHGNYIELNQGWSEAIYANPTITFPYGEIGYSLDGLYGVLAVSRDNLTKEHLVKMMSFAKEHDELTIEIYGGDDCFTTFYHSRNEGDLDETFEKIKSSPEDILQVDLSVEAIPDEEVREVFLDIFLQTFNYFSEQGCLSPLPGNPS